MPVANPATETQHAALPGAVGVVRAAGGALRCYHLAPSWAARCLVAHMSQTHTRISRQLQLSYTGANHGEWEVGNTSVLSHPQATIQPMRQGGGLWPNGRGQCRAQLVPSAVLAGGYLHPHCLELRKDRTAFVALSTA